MKIAFVLSESACISPFSGIRIQAEAWASELEKQGHQVVRINPWNQQDWRDYDTIHLIGYCTMLNKLSKIPNGNVVFSPIIDSFQPIWKYRLVTYWGANRLRLVSHNYEIRQAAKYIRKWCVRTHFEYEYVHKAYGIPDSKISVIPLSYRIKTPSDYPHKEQYCLHVSKITDARKNVLRLVDAAIKYKFKLVLAGSVDSSFDNSLLKRKIDNNENIHYYGCLDDDQLIELYKHAKVFALPSIGEGVGLVALEAAVCGCDIVVTNIGGPKEYYGDMAFVVNPYNVDEIGVAVINALSTSKHQPDLMNYIKQKYNLSKCVSDLVDFYKR